MTCDTGAAAVECQISTRVFEPARNPTGPFVHHCPAESVTELTEVVLPACTAIAATSA